MTLFRAVAAFGDDFSIRLSAFLTLRAFPYAPNIKIDPIERPFHIDIFLLIAEFGLRIGKADC